MKPSSEGVSSPKATVGAATIKIVAIGDTHGLHRQLVVPHGDILIHVGDMTLHGTLDELEDFNKYLGELPHRHKIVIAGNHDFCLEQHPQEARAVLSSCAYLQDQALSIAGIKFYGSPWQPWFGDWAFNLRRGPEIKRKWDLVPPDTDVLITHGPPWGYGDRTMGGIRAGCRDLLVTVERIRPRVHIFGHIHEAAGIMHSPDTVFINASSCNVSLKLANPPLVWVYELS